MMNNKLELRVSALELTDYGKCILSIFEASDADINAKGEKRVLKDAPLVVIFDIGVNKYTKEDTILGFIPELKKRYKEAKKLYTEEQDKIRLKFIKRKK